MSIALARLVEGGGGDHDGYMFSDTVLMWVTLSLAQDLSLLSPHGSAPSVNVAPKVWGQLVSHHLIIPWTQTPSASPTLGSLGGLGSKRVSSPRPSTAPDLPLTPMLSALCRASQADGHPLCTASLNSGASVWKKLCRAGSCPLPPLFHLLVLTHTCILGHSPSQRRG